MTSENEIFSSQLLSLNERLTSQYVDESEIAGLLSVLTQSIPTITFVTLAEYMALKNCVLQSEVSSALEKRLTDFAIEYGSSLLESALQALDYYIKNRSTEEIEHSVDVIYVLRFSPAPWNIVPTLEQELGFLKHFYKLLHNEDYIELTEDFAECRRGGIRTGYILS